MSETARQAGRVPTGWQCIPLGEAGEIVSGVTLGRRLGTGRARHVPYLRVANVKDGHLDLSDVYDIEATETEIEKLRLRFGDLLLTEGGDADKLGRGTFWQEQLPLCIHQNHIFRVRLDQEQFSPEFVAKQIGSPYGKAYFLAHAKQTTGIATINQRVLAGFPLMVPSLAEQRRIAAILNEQMAAVERARAAAEAQLEAAKALPVAYLRTVFYSEEARQWPRKRIGETCDLLPSKSIATNGDTEVQAVTTACLTESGFQPTGVKRARMWGTDAAECVVSPGEVLVARSNTSELVGRVAMFAGKPQGAVASDLTIRLRSQDGLAPAFLASYLSYLYVSGYWRTRAGGASGSMKKITRGQILKEEVPAPDLAEQQRTVGLLTDRMAQAERLSGAIVDELSAIERLPAALLRRAFAGEI